MNSGLPNNLQVKGIEIVNYIQNRLLTKPKVIKSYLRVQTE